MAPTSDVQSQLPSLVVKGSGNLVPITAHKAEARWRRMDPEEIRPQPQGRRNGFTASSGVSATPAHMGALSVNAFVYVQSILSIS